MRSESALSPLDAAFLLIESDVTPMHMATVGIFDGGPLLDPEGRLRIDDLRRLIESRTNLVPKLRQMAYSGLLGEAPPVWLDDPDFDITEHVWTCRVAHPGGENELRQLCGEILAVPLNRRRPLWELIFVEGMADQKIALIEKLHHSMADGLAAAELATVLLDLSPDLPAPPRGRPWQPVTPQPVWRAALEDLLRLGALSVRAAQWGLRSAWHPLRRAREVTEFGRAVGTLISPKTLAPHSSLNHQITPARRIDFVRLPFAEMQKAAHTTGTTVNDVLLTVVAGGLHQLMESRGELTPNSEVQVLVPVGLPGDPERGMANRVSAQFVRLPIGKDDPWQILRRVAQEVAHNKSHHQELVAATFLQILAPLPQDLLASVAGLAQHQPFFNLIVTNVPGPTIPLYALGAKLLEAFPMVPLAGNQSLGVAALSYEGQLNLGILSDPATCPDADVFCRGVQASLEALVTRLAVPHP